MKKQVKEVVIRLKADATVVCEEIFENNIIVSKHINIEDLCSAINSSIRLGGTETGILPEGCVYYKEDMDKSKYIVIKYSGRVDFTLYNTVYKDLPLPNMLFGFKISNDGYVSKKWLLVLRVTK